MESIGSAATEGKVMSLHRFSRPLLWSFLLAGTWIGPVRSQPPVQPAAPTSAWTVAIPAPTVAPSLQLDELIRLGLERNPRLAQAAFAIDAARGRAVQAGLY